MTGLDAQKIFDNWRQIWILEERNDFVALLFGVSAISARDRSLTRRSNIATTASAAMSASEPETPMSLQRSEPSFTDPLLRERTRRLGQSE